MILPLVIIYLLSPMIALQILDLPIPFGPMIAWISPSLIFKLKSFRSSLSSTFKLKFSIFNIKTPLKFLFVFCTQIILP